MNPTLRSAFENAHKLGQFVAGLDVVSGTSLMIGCGVLAAGGGIILARAMAGPRALVENNVIGGFAFVSYGQVFAAMLTFILIDCGVRYADSVRATSREARAIRLFHDAVGRFDQKSQYDLQYSVKRYALSVVEDEWSTLADEHAASPKTAGYIRDVYRRLMSVNPAAGQNEPAYLEACELFMQIVDSRDLRLASAGNIHIANLVWAILWSMTAMAIVLTWLFGNNDLMLQLVMTAIIVSAFMGLMYFAILLDHPFRGSLAINSAAFRNIGIPLVN